MQNVMQSDCDYVDLAVASDGTPYVTATRTYEAYVGAGHYSSDLLVSKLVSGTWHTIPILRYTNNTAYVEGALCCIDADDHIWVFYHSPSSNVLRCCSSSLSGAFSWIYETVGTMPGASELVEAGVDHMNKPFIVTRRGANSQITVFARADGAWQSSGETDYASGLATTPVRAAYIPPWLYARSI
jgi:hypothetical protein